MQGSQLTYRKLAEWQSNEISCLECCKLVSYSRKPWPSDRGNWCAFCASFPPGHRPLPRNRVSLHPFLGHLNQPVPSAAYKERTHWRWTQLHQLEITWYKWLKKISTGEIVHPYLKQSKFFFRSIRLVVSVAGGQRSSLVGRTRKTDMLRTVSIAPHK